MGRQVVPARFERFPLNPLNGDLQFFNPENRYLKHVLYTKCTYIAYIFFLQLRWLLGSAKRFPIENVFSEFRK